MASQITSLGIVYSTVYLGTDQRKYQSSASLTFVRGIRRWPVNSPHKWWVTRKMFPFDDVMMKINKLLIDSIRNSCNLECFWGKDVSYIIDHKPRLVSIEYNIWCKLGSSDGLWRSSFLISKQYLYIDSLPYCHEKRLQIPRVALFITVFYATQF